MFLFARRTFKIVIFCLKMELCHRTGNMIMLSQCDFLNALTGHPSSQLQINVTPVSVMGLCMHVCTVVFIVRVPISACLGGTHFERNFSGTSNT